MKGTNMPEIDESRTSKISFSMEGQLAYWQEVGEWKYVATYYQLMSGAITLEEANHRMGAEYYKEIN